MDGLEQSTEYQLYRRAQSSMRAGNYDQAVAMLEGLESQFPFGRYAEQAQLELIYARYMSYDHDAARAAADRFIRLHPHHDGTDYAYYIKGLGAYHKSRAFMDRLFSTDVSKRDMTPVREAYADFAQLLARYPNSQYVPDARQRMIYLRNVLARSELNVADYYMRRGAYVAAANRARYVVENYPRSKAVPDALALAVEANHKMGLDEAANDALRVLALNHPAYPAFDDAGQLVLAEAIRNRDRSWLNLMSFGLLDRPDVPPPLRIRHPEGFDPPAVAQPPEDESGDEQSVKEKKKTRFGWLPFLG